MAVPPQDELIESETAFFLSSCYSKEAHERGLRDRGDIPLRLRLSLLQQLEQGARGARYIALQTTSWWGRLLFMERSLACS